MPNIYYKVFGRVQGVGFRYFTLRSADRLGVKGWVRNAIDGSVEVLASGTQVTLLNFEKELSQGPSYAHVSKIQRREQDDEEYFDQFSIVH